MDPRMAHMLSQIALETHFCGDGEVMPTFLRQAPKSCASFRTMSGRRAARSSRRENDAVMTARPCAASPLRKNSTNTNALAGDA